MKSIAAQAWPIVRNDLRLYWRSLQGNRRGFASYALLLFLVLVLHVVVTAAMLGAKSPPPPGVQVLMWAFLSLMMTGGAMNHAILLLYTRSDFDLLLSSPLPARAVLLARLGSVAVSTFLTAAIFVIPVLDGAVVRFSPRFAGTYLVFALLAVLTSAIATAATLFLVRWFGVQRARLMAMVIAAGFGSSVSLVSLVPMMLSRAKFAALVDRFLHAMRDPMFAFTADAGRFSPLPLAILALLSAGAVLLTVRLMAQTFVSGLQSTATLTSPGPATDNYRWTAGQLPARLRKEYRLIVRSPLLVMQLLPMVFMVGPMAVILSKVGGVLLLPPVTLFTAAIFSFLLAEVACAGEVGWDLVRLSPTPEPRMRWTKLAACVIPPLCIAIVLTIWVALSGRPGLALFTLAASTICAAGCAWVGVVTIKASPRYDLIQTHNPSLDPRQLLSMAILAPGTAGIAMISFGHYALGTPFVGATLLCVLGCFTLLEPRRAE